MGFKRNILIVAFFFLFLADFYVWRFIFRQGNDLEVTFFDIGQGDAIFIETPQGHQILIDGGPDKKILEKLSGQFPFWDRSLDLAILTHPESDHLQGLNYVLDSYRVENILWTGVLRETKIFEKWLKTLDKEKAQITIAQRGQKIKAGKANFYILYPAESLVGKFFRESSNETSIALKLLFAKNTFLFTGDITEKTERELLPRSDAPVGLAAEVLKVPHHGSKNSSLKEFLEAVNPQIAVISCVKNNPYGHPHQETLNNLSEFAVVLRTDEQGDIKIVSDGEKLKISTAYGFSAF